MKFMMAIRERTFLSSLGTIYKIPVKELNYYQFTEINYLRKCVIKYHNMLIDITAFNIIDG